ncbi:D-cysteine desulfhydrase, partial [Pseudomonas syringae pv. tagetis]
LVLEEELLSDSDPDFNGNYFLYHLLGAEKVKVVQNGTDLMKEMQKVAEELTEEGHTPFIIPVGGSNRIGATGYAACAQ